VKNLVGGTLMGNVTNLRCIRLPGSRPFPSILMPIICPSAQSDGLSTVKFTGLQVPRCSQGQFFPCEGGLCA
jgi:hypothetical protein